MNLFSSERGDNLGMADTVRNLRPVCQTVLNRKLQKWFCLMDSTQNLINWFLALSCTNCCRSLRTFEDIMRTDKHKGIHKLDQISLTEVVMVLSFNLQ